jgi:hypothetical protein
MEELDEQIQRAVVDALRDVGAVTILHLAFAGLLKRARSTSTSGPGSSAVIESSPRACAAEGWGLHPERPVRS